MGYTVGKMSRDTDTRDELTVALERLRQARKVAQQITAKSKRLRAEMNTVRFIAKYLVTQSRKARLEATREVAVLNHALVAAPHMFTEWTAHNEMVIAMHQNTDDGDVMPRGADREPDNRSRNGKPPVPARTRR